MDLCTIYIKNKYRVHGIYMYCIIYMDTLYIYIRLIIFIINIEHVYYNYVHHPYIFVLPVTSVSTVQPMKCRVYAGQILVQKESILAAIQLAPRRSLRASFYLF